MVSWHCWHYLCLSHPLEPWHVFEKLPRKQLVCTTRDLQEHPWSSPSPFLPPWVWICHLQWCCWGERSEFQDITALQWVTETVLISKGKGNPPQNQTHTHKSKTEGKKPLIQFTESKNSSSEYFQYFVLYMCWWKPFSIIPIFSTTVNISHPYTAIATHLKA